MTPTLWQKVRTKEALDESERGEWKSWLKAQHSENLDHGIQSHHFMGNRWENSGNSGWLYFGGLLNHCKWWLQPWNLKMLVPWKGSYDKPRQRIKKQRHHFADKGLYSQRNGFSSSHVQTWKLYHKEGWAPKNWCFWTVVLEKTLENPLDSKEMKPVNPKGNQPWIFVEKTDAEGWSSNTLATWYEEQTHWKRFWCWERLRARGEGGNRGWDGWMASLTQWAWVWANSRRW